MSFKVIIAGTRTFQDYKKLQKVCDELLAKRHPDVTIISGMAQGADLLGKKYGEAREYEVLEYPADWSSYGKYAGIKRNKDMAEVANALIAFWDHKSVGTKHMIDYAKELGLMVRIVRI